MKIYLKPLSIILFLMSIVSTLSACPQQGDLASVPPGETNTRTETPEAANLLSDPSSFVYVTGKAKLFEGTSCTTEDFESQEEFSFTVSPEQTINRTIDLKNSGFGGGDTAQITFAVANYSGSQTGQLVVASGSIHIVDDEISADEEATIPFNEQAQLTGQQPLTLVQIDGCAGDEVRVELEINVSLSGSTTSTESRSRFVVASGSIEIVDDEIFDDEYATIPFNEQMTISSAQPLTLVKADGCAGGEVRVELEVNAALSGDGDAVLISGTAKLFEGTDCATNDREDTQNFEFSVNTGQTINRTISLRNSGTGGGDTAKITLAVTNQDN